MTDDLAPSIHRPAAGGDLTGERAAARWGAVSELTSDVAFSFRVTDGGTLVSEWVAGRHEEVTGYTPREMRHTVTWRPLVVADDLGRFDEGLRRVLAGLPDTREFRIRRKDGDLRWVRVVTNPEVDPDSGRVTRVVGAAHDVTERRENEERWRALVESAPDAILIRQDGAIAYANDRAASLFGAASSLDLVGLTFSRLAPPEVVLDTPADDGARPVEVVGRRLDGTAIHLEIRAAPVTWNGRAATQLVARDVTERHRVREALERALQRERAAAARMQEVDRLKDDFLAAVSHELRTPLTPIIGFASNLATADLDPATRTDLAERIGVNARRMASLVDRLLDMADIRAGGVSVRAEPLDLDTSLRTRLSVLAGTTLEHGVEVACPAGLRVAADAAALDRIVGNLVTNAVEQSPPGATIRIEASACSSDEVRVSVTDEGGGITDDELRSLRDGITVRDGATNAGMNLSLAIVRTYVELLGGTLWVSTEPGLGTTFTFSLTRLPDGGAAGVAGPGSRVAAPAR